MGDPKYGEAQGQDRCVELGSVGPDAGPGAERGRRWRWRSGSRGVRRLAGLACALGLLLEGGAHAQLAAARIDGIAVLVGAGHLGSGAAVVLRSDVELRAHIHLWANGNRHEIPSAALLQAAQHELVGEWLIAGEAERLRVGAPPAAAVGEERNRIAQRVGGEAALSELLSQVGASPDEIVEMATRRAQVALFLDANLEGDNVVTEAAVDAALVAEGESDPAQVSPERRSSVRERLARESLERGVERWVRVLRARTVVRVFARYGDA